MLHIIKSLFPTRKNKIHLFFISLFALLLFSCQDSNYDKVPEASENEEKSDALKQKNQDDLVARGKYLINSVGCADCHSPKRMGERGPEEDAELELSGYRQGHELPPINEETIKNGWILFNMELTAAAGPWGVSFAGNLTSDETGIGNWTFEQFQTALRKGKYKGMENNRDLLPPMPWPKYANFSDDDLKAMFAYLKSTKPVENVVPAPIPPDKIAELQKN